MKASVLAAGKGLVVRSSKQEAKKAVEEILVKKCFGGAGDQVVLEELLTGLEVSLLGKSSTTPSLTPTTHAHILTRSVH